MFKFALAVLAVLMVLVGSANAQITLYSVPVASGNLGGRSGVNQRCAQACPGGSCFGVLWLGNERNPVQGYIPGTNTRFAGSVQSPTGVRVANSWGEIFGPSFSLLRAPQDVGIFPNTSFSGAMWNFEPRTGERLADCAGYTSTGGNTYVYNHATQQGFGPDNQAPCSSFSAMHVLCAAVPSSVFASEVAYSAADTPHSEFAIFVAMVVMMYV